MDAYCDEEFLNVCAVVWPIVWSNSSRTGHCFRDLGDSLERQPLGNADCASFLSPSFPRVRCCMIGLTG